MSCMSCMSCMAYRLELDELRRAIALMIDDKVHLDADTVWIGPAETLADRAISILGLHSISDLWALIEEARQVESERDTIKQPPQRCEACGHYESAHPPHFPWSCCAEQHCSCTEFRSPQEALACNNGPPQHEDSRQTPTGSRRQDAAGRPRSSQTGT